MEDQCAASLKTDAVACYFQSEWQINEKWSLTGGLRYSKDEKEVIERLIGQQKNTALTPLALFDALVCLGRKTHRCLAPDFVRWDARASWKSPTRRWEISVFINNITDEAGIRDIERETEDMNFQRTITTTEPRLYGIGVRYHIRPGSL